MAFRTVLSALGEARKGLTFSQPSKTRQEFLKESLTSTIIERFTKTGVLVTSSNPNRVPLFGDFSELPADLLEATSRFESVSDGFDTLPSKVRAMFGNSPANFVAFLSDSRNLSKAVELGIVKAPSKPVAESKTVVTDSELPENLLPKSKDDTASTKE